MYGSLLGMFKKQGLQKLVTSIHGLSMSFGATVAREDNSTTFLCGKPQVGDSKSLAHAGDWAPYCKRCPTNLEKACFYALLISKRRAGRSTWGDSESITTGQSLRGLPGCLGCRRRRQQHGEIKLETYPTGDMSLCKKEQK